MRLHGDISPEAQRQATGLLVVGAAVVVAGIVTVVRLGPTSPAGRATALAFFTAQAGYFSLLAAVRREAPGGTYRLLAGISIALVLLNAIMVAGAAFL